MAITKSVMKGPNEIVPFDHPAIHYPQLASQKFDGFRLLNLCGESLLSPALKPFPNGNMASHLAPLLAYCKRNRIVTDGEFWSPFLTFQELQSIVRSHNKPIPEHIRYYIFDMMTESEWDNEDEAPFINRYLEYKQTLHFDCVVAVEQYHVTTPDEASAWFDAAIANSQEGIILRQHNARYKHGRTTLNQDGMWKFKEFQTHDAVVVGFEQAEVMRDGIERTTDAQGKLERTYRQADYTPIDMLGAFWVEQNGLRFKVKPGKGCDNEWKRHVWANQDLWLRKHIEYKFMPHGTMDKPRIGNFVRTRPDLD